MTSDELRELADVIEPMGQAPRFSYVNVPAACAYLRACASAMEAGPVAWAATDESGKIVEALGMNESRRFSDPLYLLAMPAQAQALRLPEPMTDAEIMELYRAVPKGYLSRDGHAGIRLARSVEAEVLRRVRERNAAPAPPAQQDDEALEVLKLAFDALTCGETGDDLEDSHRCGKCDEYVDRNAPVRQRIRAFIAKRGEK